MIKAIIFDFFGVLCSDEYWNSIKGEGSVSEEFIDLANNVSLGKISWKEFVSQISAKTGKSEQELIEGYASQKLNPQFLALVDQLRKRYKTAVLSNASRETFNMLTKDVPVSRLFNEVIVSSDIGLIKPDPRIFQYALSKLLVNPEEVVFIDDSSKYIYAAKDLGMHTILYKDYGQMKTELIRFLNSAGSNN